MLKDPERRMAGRSGRSRASNSNQILTGPAKVKATSKRWGNQLRSNNLLRN
jgi:hypothetical protein